MPAMTYCAFRITDEELQQCQEMLEELQVGDRAPLSKEELQAAKSLIERACTIISSLAELARGTGFAEQHGKEDAEDAELIADIGDALLEKINLSAEDGE